MRLAFLACAALLATAGCMEGGTQGAPPSDDGLSSASGDGPAAVEDLVLDLSFDLWTEVCGSDGETVIIPVFIGGGSEPRIHFLPNETRTTLDLSWDAVNPTSAALRFRLFDSADRRLDFAGGTSPQRWELSGEDVEGFGESANLYVYPACPLLASAASNRGQTVAVHVEHFR